MGRDVFGGLAPICRRYGIDALYVFGSRASEVAHAVTTGHVLTDSSSSDVDIGVLPRQGGFLDPLAKVRLMAELEDLLESAGLILSVSRKRHHFWLWRLFVVSCCTKTIRIEPRSSSSLSCVGRRIWLLLRGNGCEVCLPGVRRDTVTTACHHPQELFHIRSSHLADIEQVLSALLQWLQSHPELMDQPPKIS